MKISRLVAIALVAVFGLAEINAQNASANVTLTKVVDTSADEVWTILRKMDDIDKYSSIIATVEWTGDKGVGGQRVCKSADGQGYFKESIIGFDDANRNYTYALLEGVPVKGMVNNFKVVDLGYQKSLIVWTSTYEAFLENPQMTEEQFLGFLNQSANEMIGNVAQTASK